MRLVIYLYNVQHCRRHQWSPMAELFWEPLVHAGPRPPSTDRRRFRIQTGVAREYSFSISVRRANRSSRRTIHVLARDEGTTATTPITPFNGPRARVCQPCVVPVSLGRPMSRLPVFALIAVVGLLRSTTVSADRPAATAAPKPADPNNGKPNHRTLASPAVEPKAPRVRPRGAGSWKERARVERYTLAP